MSEILDDKRAQLISRLANKLADAELPSSPSPATRDPDRDAGLGVAMFFADS